MKSSEAQILNMLLGAQPAPGARKITEAEKRDLRDGAELRQVMKDMEDVVAREFPSLPKEHNERCSQFNFGLALAIGDASPEIIAEVTTSTLKKLMEAEIPWALAFGKANVTDKVMPSYGKAVKAGVDPIPFLQADLQISAQEAQEVVEAIRSEEGKKDAK